MASALRRWADAVVHGTRLQDKLAPPPPVEADGAPLVTIPRWPGRPPELAVDAPTAPPPAPSRLDQPGVAQRALHAFVHHELQALELMALALLRWPDAPLGFRRALVATAADEQRHLQLYRDRLEALGGSLGEHGASTFFWEHLRAVPDPAAFVAGMSLGLEQANLDFARTWQQAFAAAGDPQTAAVLAAVYEDEVRHVAVGRVWFERWAPAGHSLFEAWQAALQPPLTPERARGPVLDREGRRRAGLSEAFVDRLAVTRVSRGRVPDVWWFVPGVEDELAGRTPTRAPAALAPILAMAASPGDVVVAPRPPDRVLAAWDAAGLVVPEFVDQPEDLGDRPVAAVHPWGRSPAVAARLARWGVRWDPAWKALSSRAWAVGLQRRLGVQHGTVCTSLEEVQAAACPGPWVAKAEWSASGRHRVSGQGPLTDEGARWVKRALQHGAVVVEPWLDRIADLSVQVEVEPQRVRVLDITRFGTARGVYRGTLLAPWTLGLSRRVLRAAHRDGAAFHERLHEVAQRVGAEAAAVGYRGPLGVDALVFAEAEQVRLLPLLEVNPRWTMGRVALRLGRRLAPGAAGVWLFAPNLPGVHAQRWPLVRDDHGRLVSGWVPTSDPGARLCSAVAVAPRFTELVDRLQGTAATAWLSPPGR